MLYLSCPINNGSHSHCLSLNFIVPTQTTPTPLALLHSIPLFFSFGLINFTRFLLLFSQLLWLVICSMERLLDKEGPLPTQYAMFGIGNFCSLATVRNPTIYCLGNSSCVIKNHSETFSLYYLSPPTISIANTTRTRRLQGELFTKFPPKNTQYRTSYVLKTTLLGSLLIKTKENHYYITTIKEKHDHKYIYIYI